MSEIPERLGIADLEFRVVFGRTRVDYDIDKEYVNREKHSYSLESAVFLMESILLPMGGPPRMTSDGFMEAGEVRHMHMTVDDSDKVVLMVTTMRPEETVRVISYRRASKEEREQFFAFTGFRESGDEG